MSTPLARRFERYVTALAMISEGVAELEPAEAASLLRSALAMVEAEPPTPTASPGPRTAPKNVGDVKTGTKAHSVLDEIAFATAARVLAYVEEHGSTTIPEVAAALGVTGANASFSLRTLANARKITRAKRGTYEAKK